MHLEAILTFCLVIWNLVTFALMGIDKRKAIKKRYRISEKTLFICAFLLGGMGINMGMHIFHHKTRHWYFKLFMPVSVLANAIIIYYLFQSVI